MTLRHKSSWTATWNDLISEDWFRAVGRRTHPTPAYVSSWDEAIQEATSSEYEDLRLGAANAYRSELAAVSRADMNSWNDVVRAIKKQVEPEVQSRVLRVGLNRHQRDQVIGVVQWDVVAGMAQAAFHELVPNGFYLGILFWYKAGHFPCGWRGQHPEGRLLVY